MIYGELLILFFDVLLKEFIRLEILVTASEVISCIQVLMFKHKKKVPLPTR